MAVLLRTTDTAVFVHVGDPAVRIPDPMPEVWPGPESNWLPEAGQPADATRFCVRPLAPSSYARVQDLYRSDDATGGRKLLAELGLVSIDGAPVDLADLAFGWDIEVANLVSAVTLRPLGGLRLRSTASE